jgi:hypothetical protein
MGGGGKMQNNDQHACLQSRTPLFDPNVEADAKRKWRKEYL